ncbi:maleylpyruvate isomerase family mycothiol-dependent enzyme [Actinomadura flavalba]|uniref:maleylpyruvate isomerase family mycothiol-dependent enzyme n=1 Tax=Actinomadura flavalba TaxID=1120938 RepID=UPI00035E4178|nr:maleylpyruvate isomerase family mycothiol-dependent enzyme [Actinomadura flavalba]
MDVFDDLAAEHALLDAVLGALTDREWAAPSAADGWSVTDVVLHLAQTEELVLASVTGDDDRFTRDATPLDAVMDAAVAAERGAAPADVLDRWRTASRQSLGALRSCAPSARLAWAAAPLSPRTLATTRLAEHWTHALDIAGPLGIAYPDTSRLRHVAWLAHRTLPYAFALAGRDAGPVRCELTAPDGAPHVFGADAPSVVRGPLGDFCRVAARRLTVEDSALTAEGPDGEAALHTVRTYAA